MNKNSKLCLFLLLTILIGIGIIIDYIIYNKKESFNEKSLVLAINEKLSLNSFNIANIDKYEINCLTPDIIEYDGKYFTAKSFGEGIIELVYKNKIIWIKVKIDSTIVPSKNEEEVLLEKITTNVIEINIKEGENYVIITSLIPSNATNRMLIWSSSDESIASVDGVGKVTGLKAGTSIITVESTNNHSVNIKVNVTTTSKEERVEANSIILNVKEKTIYEKEFFLLKESILPSTTTDKTITWLSSDNYVASVLNGKVTGLKEGIATISAETSNGKIASCIIKVIKEQKIDVSQPSGDIDDLEVKNIKLDKDSISINVNTSQEIYATISPSNATKNEIIWSSNNQTVAIVNNGKVTGLKAGTATISARTSNGKTATCVVIVTNNEIEANGITINKSKLTLIEGTKDTLVATISPSNATNKNVTWASTNSGIVSVQNGIVTGVKAGTATIIAQSNNGKRSLCYVTIVDKSFVKDDALSLKINESFKIEISDISNIVWKSSDSTVASVDENGNVLGLKQGYSLITASSGNIVKNIYVGVSVLGQLKAPIVSKYVRSGPTVSYGINTPDVNWRKNKGEIIATNLISKLGQSFLEAYLTKKIESVGGINSRGGENIDNPKGRNEGTRAGAVAAARFLAFEFPYIIPYANTDFENRANTYYANTKYWTDLGTYYNAAKFLSAVKVDGKLVANTEKFEIEYLYGYKLNIHDSNNPTNGLGCWGCKTLSDPYPYVWPSSSATTIAIVGYHGLHCGTFVMWSLYNGGTNVLLDMQKRNIRSLMTPEVGYFNSKIVSSNNILKISDMTIADWNKVKVGDIIKYYGHIGMIIGIDKQNNYMYIAHQIGSGEYIDDGVHVDRMIYKGPQLSDDEMSKRWEYIFLLDEVYGEDGNLTDLWY